MKTKWYKIWHAGIVGQGSSETVYHRNDTLSIFCGFRRLDFPVQKEAHKTWDALGVNETLALIDGSVINRIQ